MKTIKDSDLTEIFDGTKFVPGQVGVYKTIHPKQMVFNI